MAAVGNVVQCVCVHHFNLTKLCGTIQWTSTAITYQILSYNYAFRSLWKKCSHTNTINICTFICYAWTATIDFCYYFDVQCSCYAMIKSKKECIIGYRQQTYIRNCYLNIQYQNKCTVHPSKTIRIAFDLLLEKITLELAQFQQLFVYWEPYWNF